MDDGLLLPSGVLRAAVRLLFAPPPRRSFDDIGWFHRFQSRYCLFTRALSSRRRRRRRRRGDDDVLSSDKYNRFSSPRRQKSATHGITRENAFLTFLVIPPQSQNKKEAKFRRLKRGVARNRRTRARSRVVVRR